ncbi:MAG TPA: secretin N-terminal domain-containing protein [Nitrospirota bacterium]
MKRLALLFMTGIMTALLAGCAGSQAYQRGERYSQRGEWDLAVKEYREANRRDPRDIEYRSALLRAEETAANQHYKKARNFLKERKLEQAIVELQQALYLNPSNAAIQSALRSALDVKQAEEHYRASLTFVELGKLGEAISELNHATELDPENVKYLDALENLRKKRAEVEPDDALTLASDKSITLNFKNTNIKDVFDFLSKLSGINILFDDEVKALPVTVFVKDVSFQYALNLLLSTNKLFMKKVSADTIIVIPKSKSKVDQYQDLVVRTFYINNAKSKEIVNLLRSMLDIKKVYVNEIQNSITVRETPEKLKLVEKIIAANDLKEAEVILDVEILEISRSNSLKYGWNFTNPGLSTSATIQPTDSATSSSTSGGIALSELRNLSSKNVFVTLPGVVVNLIKQDSDAQTLANPRVRVLNNKQAKFHIGNKIPVQTSTTQATSIVAVTSTFEYKDIGIKVTIEPTVHLNNTVTLKMGLEISTLGDALDFGNGQKQYRFGTRNTDTLVNLRDGESVIIGGLIQDEERKSRIKVPILGDIPIIGKLFSSTDDGTIKTDILMSITPNIVRNMELPDKDAQTFWSGTEEAYDTKPLFVTTGRSSKTVAGKPADKTAVLDSMAKREATAPSTGDVQKQAGAAEQPVAAAVLDVKPAEAGIEVGQDARFDISASGMKNLYGTIITLSYDPKVMEFKSASEGTLLKIDNQQTSFLFSNNAKGGTVDLYMTRIGNVGGVDGAGSLCTVVFQGKAGGTSDLIMKNVKLTNFNREPVKADIKGAKVVVR